MYPVHFTRALAFQGSSDTDIHLYGDSKVSLYQALEEAQFTMETAIGDIFTTTQSNKPPVIKRYDELCGCHQRPASPTLAEYEVKVQDLETRLEVLENKSPAEKAQHNAVDTPGCPDSPSAEASSAKEIWPMLQKIEHKLEAIEQQMHHCPAENTTPTTPENIHGVTAAVVTQAPPCSTSVDTGDQLIPRSAQPLRLWFERMTEIPGPEIVLRSSSCSSTPTSDHDGHFEDFNSEAGMTPSASTTERSITPRAGPDAAAELNRDLLLEEIDRALARAMLNLARILGRVDNGEV